MSVLFAGRPGISPALATLLAARRVTKRDRILDVGCGTGTDLLLLARWGHRHLVGIDPDARAVAAAKGRATRARLNARVRFERMNAEDLSTRFPAASFDVVLHTLVANNLRKDRAAHFRQVARVLAPDGLLILQERITKRHENQRPGSLRPLAALARAFDLSAGVLTHLPEFRAQTSSPGYARVALWLGRPRPVS